MPVTILIGAQWGDEGKGRVTDWLAADADIVARYAGGDNAGHTVAVGDAVYKLHLVPAGVLRDDVVSVLGSGTVVNPLSLVHELDELAAQGVHVTPQRLRLSNRAHLIGPGHVALDSADESARGDGKIGTTLRGIGPAYVDKVGRVGLRAELLRDPAALDAALRAHIARANDVLRRMSAPLLDADALADQWRAAAERLAPFAQDVTSYLYAELGRGARVLCEGAQGTLLDIDHGSYPFVTSSSPVAGGALTGLGFGPRAVDRVVGVAKAFSTRVGAGPFPTEVHGLLAERLRGTGENYWDEFGVTTGRPRRCGWLDAVLLRYAAHVNGLTELVLTKLDVLSGLDELRIAVAYTIDGHQVDFPPGSAAELARAVPVFETMPGWNAVLSKATRREELPAALHHYVSRIAALMDVPISALSVGPARDQLVLL